MADHPSVRAAAPAQGPIPINRRHDRREDILDAATRLFAERTFAATPVPLVAAEAGVGTGTLYRYFPSKETLGNAVYQRAKGRFLAQAGQIGSEYDDPRQLFAAWWKALFDFASSYPEDFAFLEHQQHAGYLDERSRELSAHVDQAVHEVLRGAQRQGAVRALDPAVLTALVFGAFVGIDRQARAGDLQLDDMTRAATEAAVWDLLSGKGDTQ